MHNDILEFIVRHYVIMMVFYTKQLVLENTEVQEYSTWSMWYWKTLIKQGYFT